MTDFLPPGAPLLQQAVARIAPETIPSAEIQALIERMLVAAAPERDADNPRMLGLAAPQIGIDRAIILVDTSVREDRTGWGELEVFINPRVIWQSEAQQTGPEGCYSVHGQVRGLVSRAREIRIEALDRHGERVERTAEGLTARIFLHEIDHLHGVRFPDRIGDDGVLHWVPEAQLAHYRLHWQQWPTTFPWPSWLAMKQGTHYPVPD
ncbi:MULTISPECIES: peptide deformylase [unclassified Paludibacterium]|uniref:peptide deformylase n=1 Tax=unclassified Paludibacterium TaxID=2618429 RepID=UPI001C05DFC4|nr:peptide deformylase [Paludibacterium sp. B53371]BEV72064.1 peptide deformylase [Paludibacterium sp. THUN1379]